MNDTNILYDYSFLNTQNKNPTIKIMSSLTVINNFMIIFKDKY